VTTATGAVPSLTSSLTLVDEVIPWCSFRLGVPRDDGWIRCDQALSDSDFFPTWQRRLASRMRQDYGEVPQTTPAGYVMGWYAGLFGYLGGALFQTARRVASLAPHNLAFRLDPVLCRPSDVALLDAQFCCLPDDPAAGTAKTVVVPDAQALAAALRAEVAAHGASFVRAYRPSVRFGRRMLWAAVTDALDRGVWQPAAQRGDPGLGAADAALVLPSRLPPFTSASTVHRLRAGDGQLHWTRVRQSCCFYYKLPGVEHPCLTCPRLSPAQRAELL
jgi:hypothetical protein